MTVSHSSGSTCQQPHPRSPADPPGEAPSCAPVFGEALGSGAVSSVGGPCGLGAEKYSLISRFYSRWQHWTENRLRPIAVVPGLCQRDCYGLGGVSSCVCWQVKGVEYFPADAFVRGRGKCTLFTVSNILYIMFLSCSGCARRYTACGAGSAVLFLRPHCVGFRGEAAGPMGKAGPPARCGCPGGSGPLTC